MLKLKDFKNFQVHNSKKLKGGAATGGGTHQVFPSPMVGMLQMVLARRLTVISQIVPLAQTHVAVLRAANYY